MDVREDEGLGEEEETRVMGIKLLQQYLEPVGTMWDRLDEVGHFGTMCWDL